MSEIFGKPIDGDVIQYGSNPVEQEDPDFIRLALDELFDLKNVRSIRWEQYTPYFNDGDACEFSVNDASILLDGAPEDGGDFGDGYLDSWSFKYLKNDENYKNVSNTDEVMSRFSKVSSLICSTTHEVFMKKSFGDPAQVTATREGFSVEFYDHD